ncbi:MAG: response regulator [Sulfuricella sp.]|nr:response regulator [Sulfuricella sp.]
MNNTSPPEVYCTTRQAAEMLHVSLRTVQLWVESGVLSAWKTDGGHRRLPLSSVQELIQERMGKSAIPPPAKDGFNILVLEDDEDMLKLYKMTMDTWQLPTHVTFVSSVFEALIVIGRGTPDLLVTDLKMGGVDGFEIIKLLRNDEALKSLGIVVVTGLDPEEIAEKGGLPSDITVFPKPLSFEQLQGYIKACLAHRIITDRKKNER